MEPDNNEQQQLLLPRYTKTADLPAPVRNAWKASFTGGDGRVTDCFVRYGDRELLWKQKHLLQQLEGYIPVPDVIDFFEEGGIAYLVTEWIEGVALDVAVANTFLRRSWQQLSRRRKTLLVKYLYDIGGIIRDLHQLGWVHGKLRPDKFIVQGEKVYLVDVRTAQLPGETGKTTADDVYALGLLMCHFLTGYLPLKLDRKQPQRLYESLLYLISDPSVAKLIVDCLQEDSGLRPGIDAVLAQLDTFPLRIADYKRGNTLFFSSGVQLTVSPTELIQSSLVLPVDATGPFAPLTSAGWQSGTAGLNYVTARCPLPDVYYRSMDTAAVVPVTAPGLFEGFAGVAVALAATGNDQLQGWFVAPAGVDIAEGAAGQLLAALHAGCVMGHSEAEQLAVPYVNYLLDSQLPDGAWQVNGMPAAFYTGITGIAASLWLHYGVYKEDRVKDAAVAAMDWLEQLPLSKPVTEGPAAVMGRALACLWAYEVTQLNIYAQRAETQLNLFYEFWHSGSQGFWDGYAGIGELYLEAFRLLQNYEWKRRAHLIFTELLYLSKKQGSGYYWVTGNDPKPGAGLMTGNAGVLHFLMRFVAGAEVVPHLLRPAR